LWKEQYALFNHKIIVLDDDPTGVQTVHGVPVYTDWKENTIRAIFNSEENMVFILTNSRAFSKQETESEHKKIGERIAKLATETNQPFMLISRGDSTLRGHYPLETEVLKTAIESNMNMTFDGEIIIPFFLQGGRITINDTHYVKYGADYTPAGETEFANDSVFSFKNSNLKTYVEEKTQGRYLADSVLSVSVEELRNFDIEGIVTTLNQLTQFNKLIVNAVTEEDLKVFSIALLKVIQDQRKNFLYRTAASFTKIIGNIRNNGYLTKDTLLKEQNENGGLIIVGSHVQKTTEQLYKLMGLTDVTFIEFDVAYVYANKNIETEINRIQQKVNEHIANGQSVCIYTSRKKINIIDDTEKDLALANDISQALTEFVANCSSKPKYVIAKGGITSSDIGTISLAVKKAWVMGQVAPGVPVWETGNDSRFPNIPYIIFPGNVGTDETLKDVVEMLEENK